MNLSESLKILAENGYIAESVWANDKKLKLIIGKKLLPAKDDPEYDPDYDYLSMFDEYLARTSSTYEDTYIFSKDVLEKIPADEFKKICQTCGFNVSIHEPKDRWDDDEIWVTPNTYHPDERVDDDSFEIDRKTGLRILYHLSHIGDLDEKGIRCRSREKDNDFDVYDGRIYCIFDYNDIDRAYSMVTNEHDEDDEHIYCYRVLVPKGYEIYRDPTTEEGVYLTNNVPAKYVTKKYDPDYGFKKKWKTEWRNKGKYKKPDHFAEEEQRLKELVAASKNKTEVNGIKI